LVALSIILALGTGSLLVFRRKRWDPLRR
jgi:hypothetical protein